MGSSSSKRKSASSGDRRDVLSSQELCQITDLDELYFELCRNSNWQHHQIRRLHATFKEAVQKSVREEEERKEEQKAGSNANNSHSASADWSVTSYDEELSVALTDGADGDTSASTTTTTTETKKEKKERKKREKQEKKEAKRLEKERKKALKKNKGGVSPSSSSTSQDSHAVGGRLNKEAFRRLFMDELHYRGDKRLVDSCFRIFDADGNGEIDFGEFVFTLSLACVGNVDQKLRFLFDLFDTNKDGEISLEELSQLLLTSMSFVKRLSPSDRDNMDMKEVLGDEAFEWWEGHRQRLTESAQSAGHLTFEEFKQWAEHNLEVTDFLRQFDILPSLDEERERIRSLLSAATMSVGERWCVLNRRWWDAWKEYTMFSEELRMSGPLRLSDGPPALVAVHEETSGDTDLNNDSPTGATAGATATVTTTSGGNSAATTTSRVAASPVFTSDLPPSPSLGPLDGDSQMPLHPPVNRRKISRRNSLDNFRSLQRSASGYASLRPISIDNSELQGENYEDELRDLLVEGNEYVLVPEPAWDQFVAWYGGGPKYLRKVVQLGTGDNAERMVEIYPFHITFLLVDSTGEPVPESQREVIVSYSMLGRELLAAGCKALELTGKKGSEHVRMWRKETSAAWHRFEKPQLDQNLDELEFQTGDYVVIDVGIVNSKTGDVSWPMDSHKAVKPWDKFEIGDIIDAKDTSKKWYRSRILKVNLEEREMRVHFEGWSSKWDEWLKMDDICKCESRLCNCTGRLAKEGTHSISKANTGAQNSTYWSENRRPNIEGATPHRGVTGLANLGNTCYMNSTLQCLSNTPIASSFFISGRFEKDINKKNPIGSGGKLAVAFADLLRELWSGKYSSIAPRNFKKAISSVASHFSGTRQHDSQELLAFLLDGLHEDLNRVLDKPYVAQVEANGRLDSLVSREAWDAYRLRNRSIVVDLFMGQLKSTVVCPVPECGKKSVTFDPFMYLQVPFPSFEKRRVLVAVCRSKGKEQARIYGVKVSRHASVGDLLDAVGRMTGIHPDSLAIVDWFKGRIYSLFNTGKPLPNIRGDEVLLAFEHTDPSAVVEPPAAVASQPSPSSSSSAANVDSPPSGDSPQSPANAKKPADADSDSWVEVDGGDADADANKEKEADSNTHSKSEKDSEKDAEKEKDKEKDTEKEKDSASRSEESTSSEDEAFYIQMVHRINRTWEDGSKGPSQKVGVPCLLTVKHTTTTAALLEMVRTRVRGFLPPSIVDGFKYEVLHGNKSLSECGDLLCKRSRCVGCVLDPTSKRCVLSPSSSILVLWGGSDGKSDKDLATALSKSENLSLSLPRHPSAEEEEESGKKGVDLYDCLASFTTKETLARDNKWYCSDCKDFQQATKKLDVYRTPEVLIIQLKRFLQTSRYQREKINAYVDFPIKGLDLSEFVLGDDDVSVPVYDLYAVSNHYGGTNGGHYTAFAKNFENNKWYHFDDSRCQEVNVSRVKTQAAYVLFYRKRH